MSKEKKATDNINKYFAQLGEETHRKAIKKFKRRKVYAHYPNEIHSADIVDMSAHPDYNKENKYILTVIDIYSRYAWCIPMKRKNADDVLNSFKVLYTVFPKPEKLWTDQGGEFYNAKMKAWCKKHNIILYSTFGDHKAAVIERFNRTIKEMLYRTMTQMYTDDWLTYLPDLLKTYNNRIHSSTGHTPEDLYHVEDAVEDIYPDDAAEPAKFKTGDQVRISRIKKTFEKGYAQSWSTEIYKVAEILDTNPITYKLTDRKGDPIGGSFYAQELQKTSMERMLISKIVKKKKVNGKNMFLVEYDGYPKEFNKWLTKDEILHSDEMTNIYYTPDGADLLR